MCLNVYSVTDDVTSDGRLLQVFAAAKHRTLDHRLFEDVSVAQQDPLMTQNANVVDLEVELCADELVVGGGVGWS